MFTIEEYIELKEKITKYELELFGVSSVLKYTYKIMNEQQQKTTRKFVDICKLSEETKTHIYDSRTTENRKTETEPNTEAVG
jgi:hypothetical protein